MRFQLILILLILTGTMSYGQGKIAGTIVDQETEKAIQGAKITLTNSKMKATSDKNGLFELADIPLGFHELTVQYPKYEKTMFYTDLVKNIDLGILKIKKIALPTDIQCLSNYSFDGKSADSHTSVKNEQSILQLANRDLPHVFEGNAAVYITEKGGGTGDSEIKIRGFNQQNIGFLLNGIPLNDMEGGNFNWYHWEGLADAATSIQLQKGTSSTNFAFPSAGGAVNVIANPSEEQFGGFAQLQYGTANQLNASFRVNSGLIRNHVALSFGMTKKNGDGLIDYTWNDALSLFGGATLKFNENHKIELFGFTSSQKHGMNPFRQNIGALSDDLAESISTYDVDALDFWLPDQADRYRNYTANSVSENYTGKQFSMGKERDRFASGFFNEKESYSEKPLISLNYHGKVNAKTSLQSSLFTIQGLSGITGSAGTFQYMGNHPAKPIDFDKTIAANKENVESLGILYNEVNANKTYGLLAKINYRINDNFKLHFGVDGRIAQNMEFYQVRDLLGGDFYTDVSREISPAPKAALGDTIFFNQTKQIQRYGGYGQLVYDYKILHSYFTAGLNTVSYELTDHFKNVSGNEAFNVKTAFKPGFHLKAGGILNLNKELSIYLNGAYLSQVPTFDNLIQTSTGLLVTDAKNERFQHVELGSTYHWEEQKLKAGISGYFTNWQNKSHYLPYVSEDGNAGIIFASGISQRHLGFELEAAYEPIPLVDIHASLSFAAWVYNDDTEGSYLDYTTGDTATVKYNYYLGKLLVGGAPQTQANIRVGLKPLKGLRAELGFRYFTQYYADFDPFTRTVSTDIDQAWRLPGSSVFDARISYDLPKINTFRVQLFAHALNILNTEYISDAADNSLLQAYRKNGTIVNSHDADAAEVFFGMPFRFNLGARVNF